MLPLVRFLVDFLQGLELPPGISPALVTVVPGTAVAKDIPSGDTFYARL